MTFTDFMAMRELAPEKFGKYFRASTFCQLNKDADASVSVSLFLDFVMRHGLCSWRFSVSVLTVTCSVSVGGATSFDQARLGS